MKKVILIGIICLTCIYSYIKDNTKPWPTKIIDGKEYQVTSIHGQEVLTLK